VCQIKEERKKEIMKKEKKETYKETKKEEKKDGWKTRPIWTGFKIAVRHKLLTHYKKAKVLYD
jgi:hypothetical protein